jgi:serine/threonine protein kinase
MTVSDNATFPHPPQTILNDKYQVIDVERQWTPNVLPDPVDGHWYDGGARGVVYRARDLKTDSDDQQVSIKHIEPTTTDVDLRQLTFRNFQREVDILSGLSHTNILPLRDNFQSTDQTAAYLVQDFVEGINLATVLSSIVVGTLTMKEFLRWGIELCDVFGYLHEQEPPLLFRTLEPQKIIIDTKGHLRLVDFSGTSTYKAGVLGAATGVDGYAAPEQYQRTHLPQSDIFSIGALLHHLLTQQDPRYFLRFSFQARRIDRINPEVTTAFATIVHQALETDPEKRYVTARDMQNALKSLV